MYVYKDRQGRQQLEIERIRTCGLLCGVASTSYIAKRVRLLTTLFTDTVRIHSGLNVNRFYVLGPNRITLGRISDLFLRYNSIDLCKQRTNRHYSNVPDNRATTLLIIIIVVVVVTVRTTYNKTLVEQWSTVKIIIGDH